MLLCLAVVLIGTKVAGKPAFWSKLFPDPAAVVEDVTQVAPPHGDVSTQTTMRPDFRSASSAPRLSPKLRDVIKDNVVGVTSEEWRAWGFSLQKAEEIAEQQRAGELPRQPTARYALLMGAPEDCRGKAWTVTGTLRRMTRATISNQNLRERTVLDAWLTLPDSGDGLVHVVLADKDNDIPLGTDFGNDAPEVTFTGYFFKREAYSSQAAGGLSLAPLFLAGSISRVPVPVALRTRSDQLTPWLTWLVGVTCAGMVIVIWSFVASDAAHRSERTHELTRLPSSPSFEGVDAESPYETLQQLEAVAELSASEFFPTAAEF